jgi:hypothetical protein
MTRIAFPLCIAVGALALGACEKHSAADLPEHYKHKGNPHAATGHENAPAHSDKPPAPEGAHKG